MAKEYVYIIAPEGLREEIGGWLTDAERRYGVSIFLIRVPDWNDDLTPWEAGGVFRKAKPFGGGAARYLPRLLDEISRMETGAEPEIRRSLVGISLSGLFALWTAFESDAFANIVSISGSLWYDGFAEWAGEHSLFPAVERIYLSLGEREKNSKDPRMASVQEKHEFIAYALCGRGAEIEYVIEENTTHFSPVIPRLERAFDKLYTL